MLGLTGKSDEWPRFVVIPDTAQDKAGSRLPYLPSSSIFFFSDEIVSAVGDDRCLLPSLLL